MSADKQPRELTAEEVDVSFKMEDLGFESTAELEPLDEIIGQPRAIKALELGLGVPHSTYNIYVAGLNGTGKMQTIRKVLNDRVADTKPPSDWIYVHNFDEADRPIAVDLAPGEGVRFRQDMENLIEQLQDDLPKAFRQEDLSRERQRLGTEYEARSREALDELEKLAKEKGLAVQQTPDGQITMVPLKDDRPMTQEEFKALPDEEKEEMSRRHQEMAEHMNKLMSRGRELRRQLGADVRKIERDFAARIIEPLVDGIKKRYTHEKLDDWFVKLREHLLDHLDRFRQSDGGPEQKAAQMFGIPVQAREQGFNEYRVNVLVDNSKLDHAPVVIEEAPSYKNLFGITGGVVDQFGRIKGDFTHIRAGSLLRANGGYLVLNLLEALIEPLVWKELKRSIKSGKMQFHAYDPLGIATATAIRPEPIPLNVKFVVLGNPIVYHLLHLYDEDFGEIFKVKADFATEMDMDTDAGRKLGRFVQRIIQQDGMPPFAPSGVAELGRTAIRLAGNKKKMTAEFSRLADVVREAGYWAQQEESGKVEAGHVRKATDEKIYRSNLIAVKIRELIADGTLLIDVDGRAVGQINGLAVINLGDYAFGKPSRVTASVGIGAAGVINIERESKLSGQTYDKAMLILDGYMRNTYAQEHPVALSAGITLEQSYGMIEGDSASVAELVCLLSAIARVPLRQDIGVTGSVNQWGDVQAIGGVNEKIEGFFDVCKQDGLTGEQGVCIPAANVRHLVLRPDVIDAVREGKFHVWAVERVDEALELMSGITAGKPGEKDTFHAKVDQRLRDMIATLKDHLPAPRERESVTVQPAPGGQRDPRPPLPGQE
ncbi:MAG: AAA family ATPase [bacterium]